MLDPHGFVATCNSTHFFIVRRGEVWTSTGDYCLGGITRGECDQRLPRGRHPVCEKNFSLTDVYGADEAFVTGTFAGVVPVREVDGRVIGHVGRRAPWSRAFSSCIARAASRTARGAGMSRRKVHRAHRHVVGAAQYLDRDDARVREPRRLQRRR